MDAKLVQAAEAAGFTTPPVTYYKDARGGGYFECKEMGFSSTPTFIVRKIEDGRESYVLWIDHIDFRDWAKDNT